MSNLKIIKLDATPSTNDYLKKRQSSGKSSDGELVWTRDQTSGRGQRENLWRSDSKKSLTFSIYRELGDIYLQSPFIISAVVSLGLLRALDQFQIPDLAIKWPNDILSCNHKIGGILIENFYFKNRIRASIIGVGLNVNQDSFEALPHASSLKRCSGKLFDLEIVFSKVTEYLEEALYKTIFEESELIMEKYCERLWKRGQDWNFMTATTLFKAKLLGVSPMGKLTLNISGKKVERNSQQVQMLYETKLL